MCDLLPAAFGVAGGHVRAIRTKATLLTMTSR